MLKEATEPDSLDSLMVATGGVAVLQRRAVVAAAGLVLLALLAVLAFAVLRGRPAEPAGISGQAPPFALASFDGSRFDLPDHRGPVFIYFWASWCVPCEAEAPIIQRLWAEQYRDRGYAFVGVNMWDSDKDARAFADRYHLTFPVGRDEDGKIYLAYGVENLPMAFFVRPGLQIERRYLGQLDETELRDMLDSLDRRS